MPRNFVELLRWRVSESPEARAVLRSVAGRWEEMSWQQLDIATEELAHGLVAEGIEPGDRVAILSRSRAEWLLADLAILKAAACSVPVHADAVVADIAHMLRDSGARLVFVQDENQAARLEPVLGDTAVEKMVLMVGPAQKQGQLRWEDLRSAGRAHQAEYPDALQPRQRQLPEQQHPQRRQQPPPPGAARRTEVNAMGIVDVAEAPTKSFRPIRIYCNR